MALIANFVSAVKPCITDSVLSVAAPTDGPAIRAFIDAHWRTGHPLGVSERLFAWQHEDLANSRINFVVAKAGESGELLALLGFIPTSQFDPTLAAEGDFWLAIWKVREDIQAGPLGLQLYLFFEHTFRPRSVMAIGFTEPSRPIYRHLGFSQGKLTHFYAINPASKNHRLIADAGQLGAYKPAAKALRDTYEIRSFDQLPERPPDLDFLAGWSPRKTWDYYSQRYCAHPVYSYELHLIWASGRCVGLAVTRAVEANGGRAVKIVDLACDDAGYMGLALLVERAFSDDAVEFVDFYGAGFNEERLKTAGFSVFADSDSGIIPNYFEPLLMEHISLEYVLKTSRNQPTRFVRGDADQDRPNLMRANS